jgi:hypothetical protein
MNKRPFRTLVLGCPELKLQRAASSHPGWLAAQNLLRVFKSAPHAGTVA